MYFLPSDSSLVMVVLMNKGVNLNLTVYMLPDNL